MSIEAAIAVNRFGLGAMPGELQAAKGDPRGWLQQQVAGAQPAQHAALAGLPDTPSALREYPRWQAKFAAENRGMARDNASSMQGSPQPGRSVEESFRANLGPIIAREVAAHLSVAATTPAPFHERLVWFWSNHFTVSALKPAVVALAGPFEREAIRPRVTGRFVDLLLAATRHPAMIVYLDNNLSVAPGFRASAAEIARRPNFPQPTGLNENLAREILELHTLGVDGGYTQADVTAFARVLTGWTTGAAADDGFRFAPGRHDAGAKSLLGKTYAEDGVAQGEAVLRDLAAHPATALHIATKLARHFIADDPPPAAVAQIAAAFRDSGGELPAVYAALVGAAEAWQTPLAKFRQPVEFVTATLRAVPELRRAQPEGLLGLLGGMGQRPFFAPSPQGWPDTADAWIGADALWKRIEWANRLALRLGDSVDPVALARSSYGDALGARTERALARAESKQQGLALWLASPEFQRR